MGDRPRALRSALESLRRAGADRVVVVLNGFVVGGEPLDIDDLHVEVVVSADNLGIPGGRDLGLRRLDTDLVGFLDDDAAFGADSFDAIVDIFETTPLLGAVSLRLVDERGDTARRHVPRVGSSGAEQQGPVANFLGGACVLRRVAYLEAGGYFTDLFYGHEEIELSWRLIDTGWSIRYLADIQVFHPKSTIERHADGWRLTGRNRVWIARRTLPRPLSLAHSVSWLVIGSLRAPGRDRKRAYVAGWTSAWKTTVGRSPISWRTVWRLTRLGRPPIV